jgi:hypothetical protein
MRQMGEAAGAVVGDPAGPVAAVPRELFIAGRWRPATGGATMDVFDPSTGGVLSAVAEWGNSAPSERSDILRGVTRR